MPMLTLTPPRCHCLCQNLHTLQGPAAWGRVNETSSALPFPVINNQLGLQHGLLDASSSNTVKFPEAALAGRAWSHVQRCPWGVWGPSPLERVPLLLCPFLYVCVFSDKALSTGNDYNRGRWWEWEVAVEEVTCFKLLKRLLAISSLLLFQNPSA